MTDRNRKTSLLCQTLDLHLPQAHAVAIAAPAICAHEQPARLWVNRAPHRSPPAAQALHGKGGRVVISSNAHPSHVATNLIYTIRDCAALGLARKVIDIDFLRRSLHLPLSARVLVAPDQLLLLCIHGNHRVPGGHERLDLFVQVAKLRITVRMRRSFQSLGVGLQAIPSIVQQFADHLIAHRMPLCGQGIGQFTHALARPPQRRLWVPTAIRIDQGFQARKQARVFLAQPLTPTTPTARATT